MWMKVNEHLTEADILAYEEMLDAIAEADRQQRLSEAYQHPAIFTEAPTASRIWED